VDASEGDPPDQGTKAERKDDAPPAPKGDVKVDVGRYLVEGAIYFEFFPLDLEEFLAWRAKDLLPLFKSFREGLTEFLDGKTNGLPPPAFMREFEGLPSEYVVYGGFPAVIKEKDREIKVQLLKGLASTYLEKRRILVFGAREGEKFKSLLDYLALTNGSITDPSSIAKRPHTDFRTLEGSLSVLMATYGLRPIPLLLEPRDRVQKGREGLLRRQRHEERGHGELPPAFEEDICGIAP